MNPKWLIFTLLLIILSSSNVTSQYPTYEWNTTELGVAIGDIFEFNLTEFRTYYLHNDSYVQHKLLLNWTAQISRTITPDDMVEVGDSFSVTIQSQPYFKSTYSNYSIRIEKDNTKFELAIPSFDVSLSHNSFVDDRIMMPFLVYGPSPNYFARSFIDGLFFIQDWDTYQLIYPNEEYYNASIEFATNVTYISSFDVRVDTVTYEVESSMPHFEFYKQAIIDKKSGLITRLEWHNSMDGMSDDEGLSIERIEMIIENIKKPESNINFSLGQESSTVFSLTSFAMLTILKMCNKKEHKI